MICCSKCFDKFSLDRKYCNPSANVVKIFVQCDVDRLYPYITGYTLTAISDTCSSFVKLNAKLCCTSM